jgi:hypothetical protein
MCKDLKSCAALRFPLVSPYTPPSRASPRCMFNGQIKFHKHLRNTWKPFCQVFGPKMACFMGSTSARAWCGALSGRTTCCGGSMSITVWEVGPRKSA